MAAVHFSKRSAHNKCPSCRLPSCGRFATEGGFYNKSTLCNCAIVLLIFVDSPTGFESLIARVSNNKEHEKSAHWLMQGGGGGVLQMEKRFVLVFFPVMR